MKVIREQMTFSLWKITLTKIFSVNVERNIGSGNAWKMKPLYD